MTDLQIVNRALALFGLVGSSAAATMADTNKNPAAAIAAYPVCRNEMLRIREWPCVTTRLPMMQWDEQATPWVASHRYLVGDRVTNDTLKTYQCTIAGKSAAATGPTGITSPITDGTVEWVYVQASTATNNWGWRQSTVYAIGDLVSADGGKVYACITAGTSSGAGVGPSGVTADITDGTAHWRYYGKPVSNMSGYPYVFILPPDCLRIIKISKAAMLTDRDQGQQYKRQGIAVYCEEPDSILEYVYREEDPTLWDEQLQNVVVHRIAVEIAITVTGDAETKKDMESRYAAWLNTADDVAHKEASESKPKHPAWRSLV